MFFLYLFLLSSPALAQQPPALVQADPVISQPFSETFPVLGRVVLTQKGSVAAQINAPVLQLLVNVGDRVSQGQLIARLSPRFINLNVALKQAEIEVSTAKLKTEETNLTIARQALERVENLAQSASFSRARYEDAQQELLRARALVEEAKASLQISKIDLDIVLLGLSYTEVKAPYDGVIIEKHTEKGSYVSTGDAIVSMVNDAQISLEANVPIALLQGLRVGTQVNATFDNDSYHAAVIRSLLPQEDSRTRTRLIRLTPSWLSPIPPVADNQSITLNLPIGDPRTILSVHKDALNNQPDGTFVFVIDPEDKVQLRTITLGAAINDRFEVTNGLEQGDLVVIRGNERLFPGQSVRYQPLTSLQ